MDDILVLHSSDATDCSKYILDYLARDEYHLRTSSLLDSSLELDWTATKVKALILILSAGHLDYLRNCSVRSSYEEQIRNAGTTLVYLYGVGENEEADDYDEVTGKSLRNLIPDYGRLQKFSFEQHQELLKTTMIKVEGLDAPVPVVVGQGARAAEKKTGGGVAGGRKGSSKRSTQQRRAFRVIPKTARCEASTAMIISLCDPTHEEGREKEEEGEREEEKRKGRTKVEEDSRKDVVTVAFGSNNPEQQIVLPTERINRNTFLFFAPERSEGVVPIHIVVNGDVIGQSSVVYQSLQSDLVLAVSQVYIFLLNRLLGLLQDSRQLTPEVDRRLCGLLEDEEANSIPIQAFEQLFSLSAAFKGRSDFELPTLLHLAAKYGLDNFASKLKDLPDSGLAFELRNHLGHTPQELTRLRRQAPIANSTQLQKHPMMPNASVDVKDEEEDEEGVYEKFCPMEEEEQPNLSSSTTDKEDRGTAYGKVLEQEDPYMVIPPDPNEIEGEERRSVVHPMFPDPPIFKTGGGVAQQPPSSVNSKQAELVSIQRQVKSNELTIYEAEVLFKEWQLRNSSSSSSSSDWDISKASMLSHTVPRPISKPMKTKVSIVERLFKKTKTPPKQSKTTHLLSPSSPSIPEEQYPPPSPASPSHHPTTTTTTSIYDIYSPSSPRNSIASSSSRDSCMSKGSTSGIETVDEEDDVNDSNVYETPVTTFTVQRKSSANLEQLEEDLRRPNAPRPPPPPPRKPPIKTSTVVNDDVDKVEYLSMDGTCKKPAAAAAAAASSGGQRRQGPPVGPRARKMSCPTVEPHCSPVNRQFSLGQTNQDDSPADGDAKYSSGDACRPSSLAVESLRNAPVPARKMSLPNKIPDNANRVRPLPPMKK